MKLQNKLQVYWAKALAGKGERRSEITIWVYNDAHVHVLEEGASLMAQNKEIKLVNV